MRALTQAEVHRISGSYFIEGYSTDDFAVIGAGIGLACGIIIPYINNFYYPKRKPMTLVDTFGCVFCTSAQAAVYGAIIDGLYYGTSSIVYGMSSIVPQLGNYTL